jgi:uncharacterized protein YcfJ
MKSIAITALLAASLSAVAQQGPAPYYDSSASDGDWATVRRVVPVVEQVSVPRRVCQQGSMAVVEPQGSPGGAVLGAVVGGVLGNQVGHGRGRAAATAVGMAIGAGVGFNNGPQDAVVTHVPTSECYTVSSYAQRTTGYRVTYVYGGREYETMMADRPGRRIRVHIAVEPMDGGAYRMQPPMAPLEPVPQYRSMPPMSYYGGAPAAGYVQLAPTAYTQGAYVQQAVYTPQGSTALALSVSMGDPGGRSSRGAYQSGYQAGFQGGVTAANGYGGGHHEYGRHGR